MSKTEMTNLLPALALLLAIATVVNSQQSSHPMKMDRPVNPAVPSAGIPAVHHPISTASDEAQKFFDHGLAFIYAFNHDEAIHSFKLAAERDPQMAMAYWGIALALGPNINLDVDPAREKAAYEAAQKALSLAVKAPVKEHAYISALTRRYSVDPKADLKKLAVDYKKKQAEWPLTFWPDDVFESTGKDLCGVAGAK